MHLRHYLSILTLALLGSALAPAQNIDALPSITGAEIVPANDKILVRDASVSAAAGAMRSMTLAELANVPGLFVGVGGGDLTSGPVTSSGGTSAIADGALSIAKTSGLQTALNAKAPLANPTFTGTVTVPDSSLAIAKISGLQTALDSNLPVINIKSYGAIGNGVANDTAAIQAAINAAAISPLTRTVYAPPGHYRCNVVIPPEIKLIGAGGGTRYNFDVPPPAELTDRTVIPTVFVPWTTAEPVIKVPEFFGNHFADFMVAGTSAMVGTGIRFGGGGVGYTGSHGTMDRVQVSGFEKAYWNDGVVDMVHNACCFVNSVYCVYYTGGSSIAPGDTNVFNACSAGGSASDYCFYLQGRCVIINTGDYNLAKHMLYMMEGAIVTVTSLNTEGITLEPIQIVSGWLNITSGRFSPVPGTPYPLVRVYGPTTTVSIGDAVQLGAFPFRKGRQVIYATGDQRTPRNLPRGYAIERYSDYTYTTYKRTDLTDWTHRGTPIFPQPNLADEFIANKSAAPYGALGWQHTQIGGVGGLTIRNAAPSQQLGVIELVPVTNNSGCSGRFAINDIMLVPSGQYYNMRMSYTFALGVVSDTIFRAGMYDLSGTPDLKPANGVGVRLDSAIDTTLKLEIITAGVSTIVDTGATFPVLEDYVGVMIERTAEGVYCWISQQTMGGGAQFGTEVFIPNTGGGSAPIPGGYMSPAVLLGNRTGTYANVALDRFSLDFYEP